MSSRLTALPLAALGLVSFAFSGCETPGEGAATGAIAGAIIGAAATGELQGAAIGAGAGAASGALIGKANQEDRRRRYGYYEEDRAYAAGYSRGEELRVARYSSRRGYVISPYHPNALVDVRGMRPGSRVLDPVSQRVFIVP